MCTRVVVTATFLLLPTPALAEKLESGPETGTAVPALKVYVATGPHADEELDYPADRKGKPTVILFVAGHTWDRPVARFVKKLDDDLAKLPDVRAVAVWLTEDVRATEQYLPLAHESLKFRVTDLACFPEANGLPNGWILNRKAGMTAVVVTKGKVAASLAFRAATEADVPVVVRAVEKARGGK